MIFIVTRHPGAIEYIRSRGIDGTVLAHLDMSDIERLVPGDIVVGVLPVHLAVAVLERRARVVLLQLDLPPELRGQELTAEQTAEHAQLLELCILVSYDGQDWHRQVSPRIVSERMVRIGLVPWHHQETMS